MYIRILVPLDGSRLSEQVISYVLPIAEKLKAHVQLLRVIEPVDPALADPAHGRFLDQISTSMRNQAEDSLGTIRSAFTEAGVEVSSEACEGSPASSIVAEANKDPATLIAMSTHGRSGVARWVMGSVTDKVLHSVQNPLLIVRPEDGDATTETNIQTIVVPLDGSALAEQVLPHVMTVAKALDCKISLIRVTLSRAEYMSYMSSLPVDSDFSRYNQSYEEFAQMANAEATEYLHKVKAMLEKQGAPSVEERLLHAHPATAIIDIARETSDNLVAMTTHGRSGIGRWALGSVADRVIRGSGDPVLLVRATG